MIFIDFFLILVFILFFYVCEFYMKHYDNSNNVNIIA